MSVSDLFQEDVYAALLRSWLRTLRARNRSPKTIVSYMLAANQLAAHARTRGRPELTGRRSRSLPAT
jgi:hypothetical protein